MNFSNVSKAYCRNSATKYEIGYCGRDSGYMLTEQAAISVLVVG